jgi:hypothetical protein
MLTVHDEYVETLVVLGEFLVPCPFYPFSSLSLQANINYSTTLARKVNRSEACSVFLRLTRQPFVVIFMPTTVPEPSQPQSPPPPVPPPTAGSSYPT